MDGTPPALPTDSEDVVWALQTAESLWKRGERVDAVVWVRRAAQAAGESDDAKRAATLARFAADLGDWIGSHTIGGDASKGKPESVSSLQALDALLDMGGPLAREVSDAFVLSSRDVEVVSAKDFEAGFAARSESPKGTPSDNDVMTVSVHAPDVEIVEEGEFEVSDNDPFPEEEPTPVRHMKSPAPPAEAPTAAQAHAGMLDPWSENDLAKKKPAPKRSGSQSEFDEEEVVTSAKLQARTAAQPPPVAPVSASVPAAPRAPTFAAPRARPSLSRPVVPEPSAGDEEAETTTYRQINPRSGRGGESAPAKEAPPIEAKSKAPAPSPSAKPKGGAPPPDARPRAPAPPIESRTKVAAPSPDAKPKAPPPAPTPAPSPPPTAKPSPPSSPPALDLLEMVDSVVVPATPSITPHPSAAPTPTPPKPSQVPQSARPTAPPPSSMPTAAMPTGAPTRPRLGATLLDLDAVEALGDLPDDAREAFGAAATIHGITIEEEVSHFALALVVEGDIDVSATIVDAPALRLSKNAVLRSRGTLVPGVALRLVCNSQKATVATWDDAAVAEAFRSCPWVEDDLRAVADRVQAKAGVTMGPLGERLDMSLREHLTSKLTLRNLAPGEVLVEEGKPVGILIVGIGDIILANKSGERSGTAGPGDFVFPGQTLAHGKAPGTATAGVGGAVVLVGDRATAQDLLMTFPPLLEVLAML